MKLSQLIIITAMLSTFAFSQNLKIKFIVNDQESFQPVTEAEITLSDKFYGSTNKFGEKEFNGVKPSRYKLSISHINYQKFESEINLVTDTTIVIPLKPTLLKLNEVIVTSGKYEKDINSVPFSITAIKESDLVKSPSFTVSDLLKNEAGISLLRDGIWGTEISIRGLNRANIVTLIDGNRIETSTDISARLSMFNMSDIERIEVIKGAVSSLYGSGATGGIVNLISKSGSYSSSTKLSGSYSGGYNSVNNFYSNGLTLIASGNEWIAKLSGNFRKAGNTKTPSGELFNSQFEDKSFDALFQVKPFEDQELKFNFQQFNASNVGIPGAAPLFSNIAIVSYPKEQRRMISVEYKINNITRSFVKLTTKYFNHFILRDVENLPGVVNYATQPFRRVSVLKINPGAEHYVNGFQTQADFTFSNHYLIAGFDFWKRSYSGLRSRLQKIEILNSADSSVIRTTFKTTFEKPLPDADFNSAGLFVQDEIKLFDKFDITVGGRYDFIWLKNSQVVNPLYEINDGVVNNNPAGQKLIWNEESAQNKSYVFNLGIIYSFNDFTKIAFNGSKSFRSPSLEERYQFIDLTGGVVRIGNPDLNPEQGYFFDLGFRVNPENLKFNSSFFLNSLTDLVTETIAYDGTAIDTLKKVNVGKALLYGFEYSISYNLFDQLNLYHNLSFVRGINKVDDTDLPQISPLNGILGIRYRINNFIAAGISTVMFDSQDKIAVGEKATPGYVTLNCNLDVSNIDFAGFKAGLSIGAENILDKEYRNHLSTNRGLIISEPGRNLFLRVNIKF